MSLLFCTRFDDRMLVVVETLLRESVLVLRGKTLALRRGGPRRALGGGRMEGDGGPRAGAV